MTGRPGSRVLALAAFVAALLATVLRLGVDAQALLWAAPFLLLVAPLALGRFVGEDVIERRRSRHRPRARSHATVALEVPRRTPRAIGHRGLLLAFRLAERGPPAAACAA
jgi:hypothetical protein